MKAAVRKWEAVREFAQGLPEAVMDFPWGPEDCVVKVNKKIFVFLGGVDGPRAPGLSVKLKDEALHGHAMTAPGAEPTGYGLGRPAGSSCRWGRRGRRPSTCCASGWRRATGRSPSSGTSRSSTHGSPRGPTRTPERETSQPAKRLLLC